MCVMTLCVCLCQRVQTNGCGLQNFPDTFFFFLCFYDVRVLYLYSLSLMVRVYFAFLVDVLFASLLVFLFFFVFVFLSYVIRMLYSGVFFCFLIVGALCVLLFFV